MSREAEHQYRHFEYESWERAAPHYADSFATFTALFAQPLLDAAGCSTGMRLLEIASGTGHISQVATALGASAVGVDFSAAMVVEAARRCRSAIFLQADAENLPFEEASFDAVVIGFGVHHFPCPQRSISEARRVLRIGGKLAFTVWSSSDNKLQQVQIDGIAEGGLRGSALPTAPNGDISSVDACIRLLSEAGFALELSSARKVAIGIAIPSAQHLLDITSRSTARGAALIRAQPERVMPAVVASIEKAMEPYRYPDRRGYELPAVAILAVATRT